MINYKIKELVNKNLTQKLFEFKLSHQKENQKEVTEFIFYLTQEELNKLSEDIFLLKA